MSQPGVPQPNDVSTVAPASASPKPPGRWWRWPLGLLAGGAALTAVVSVWLPDFVRPRIEAAAAQALGTPVRISAIDIQPWTLSVAVRGVSLGLPQSPWFTLREAQAQLSAESLWRLAPVVRRVKLIEPKLTIERQSAERLNISPMLDHLRAAPSSPPSGDPARFAIYNIALIDGALHYRDDVLHQEHTVDQVQFSVPFVSNLPSFVKVEVEPALSARIDGSPLALTGRSLPFTQGRRSQIDVRWREVSLPHWAQAAQAFLPPAWQLAVPTGQLDTELAVRFEERAAPDVPSLVVTGGLQLKQVAVTAQALPGLGPLATGWTSLAVTDIDARPLERQVRVGSVTLQGLTAALKPAAPAAAASAPAKAQANAKAKAKADDWRWQVGSVRVQAPSLNLQTEATAPWPGLRAVQLDIKQLASDPKAAPATWRLAWADEHGAAFKADGDVQVAQAQAHATWDLSQLKIVPWLAPVSNLPALRALPLQLRDGQLGLKGQVAAQWAPAEQFAVTLKQGQLTLGGIQTRASAAKDADQLNWQDLTLDGIEAQLGAAGLRSVALEAITLQGLNARLTRDAQGRVLGLGGAPGADEAAAPNRSARAAPASSGPMPTWSVAKLSCQSCQIRVSDQTVSPAGQFDLTRTELSVQGLSQDMGKSLAVALTTQAQGKGRLSFKGQVRPQPLSVQAQVGVSQLELSGLQPYLAPLLNVSLAAGKAQANGRVSMSDDPRQGLRARYQGGLGLTDLRVLDRINDADILTWTGLSLQGMDVAWNAGALDASLGRIQLKDFYGRVIINPTGQVNLASIVRHEPGAELKSLTTPEPAKPVVPGSAPAPAPTPAPVVADSAAPAKPAPLIRWDQIALSGGRVDFTDNFIKPNYSARLTRVEGEVSAVSSTKPEPATVRIGGAVDDAAPLLITGQLHPLGPRLFTDIEGSAKGIELTRLTPYASRYAGYAIDKGTLSVKVHYKVDGGKLQAENQIFLDQLTFGEKTDSPDATSLPVRFAVSLLQNSKGEIDVALPISGSLDEPQFSVGGIIWKVIVNLITKAVTAPFALLSGGGSQELGLVGFAPGSTELSDESRQRLDTLATKLTDRPALKLEATGMADPVSDAEGLRDLHLARLLRAAKARATQQPVADVVVEAAERDTWLAAAYKAADIKKPRNLVGLAKTLPPAEMAALLKASAVADDAALRDLANRRGDLVKAYLSSRMAPERVLLTASKVASAPASSPKDDGPPSRVQFQVR